MPAPGFNPLAIGLVSTGRTTKIRPPQTDPLPISESRLFIESAFGLVLERSPGLTRPARARFPAGPEGDELFKQHLAELREKHEAAEKNRVYDDQGERPAPVKRGTIYRDGRQISWLDLRVVRCAGCRRTLLGPSDEVVRARARARRSKAAEQLPPPVAGSVNDRPVCAGCLADHAGLKGGAA